MSLLEINGVSRYYEINKNKKYVLKNITLSFPHTGFVSILGKSGCGKSTLLNIIGGLDKPSEGKVYFNNQNIAEFKEKELSTYHNADISFIFQHYYLLEHHTALFNVMLPCLIKGIKKKLAEETAIKLLNSFSIDQSIIHKKCKDLSGGEKERIAILRSLINKPQVILADEPTGALDKNNAVLVMKTLKKFSESALIIMVTHNQQLAYQYSDRIIKMQDGHIIDDQRINNQSDISQNKERLIHKNNSNWLSNIISSNFKRRFRRNIFTISSLTIGLLFSLLIIGFNNGKTASIKESMKKQFDYGVATINKEKRINNNNSPITLIQSMRPSEEEIYELKESLTKFYVGYSYDALVSPFPEISINDSVIEDISYTPIYSFIDHSINDKLLIKGSIPSFDTLNKVVINKICYTKLKKTSKYDPLLSYLRIKESHHYSFESGDSINPYITDYFSFDRLVQIVGVVDEISFLNTPKIYYSYLALDNLLNESYLNNLSAYKENISWKTAVINAHDNEVLSSYTCRLFLKDYQDDSSLRNINQKLDDYVVNSNALTIEETLFSLVDAASIGMEIFLAIALVGVALIIGIISFASYSEDIKNSAILLCLGAKRDDIALIYVIENLLLGLISIVLSILIALVITNPLNIIIEQFTSLASIISIPFKRFLNRTLLLPIMLFVSTMLVCLLATYLPITFSKKISLKEELKAND